MEEEEVKVDNTQSNGAIAIADADAAAQMSIVPYEP